MARRSTTPKATTKGKDNTKPAAKPAPKAPPAPTSGDIALIAMRDLLTHLVDHNQKRDMALHRGLKNLQAMID